MAKILKCGDVMPGCNFVAEGKDVTEVMAKGAAHAKTAHGMTTIPPEIAKKVQAAIKDCGIPLSPSHALLVLEGPRALACCVSARRRPL